MLNTEKQKKRNIVVRAAWISILGNSLLACAKLVVGFISGSFAVVADGIDSSMDILSSVVTLVAARVVSKPPNIKFPYGYIKADTIATKVLSLIIILAGFQLLIASAGNLTGEREREIPQLIAIYVTLFSIAGKLLLSLYLGYIGKKNNSKMMVTMGIHMRSDMLISLAVLFSLVLTYSLDSVLVDTIFALAISIYIIYTAFRIFLKSNTELMDGIEDAELYKKLFEAVNAVEGASNPHRARARKIGNNYMINLDVEVDPEISVNDAHIIAQEVENVLPEVVHTNEKGYKSIEYDKISALLIEAIKEQQETINAQQKEINNLKKHMGIVSE